MKYKIAIITKLKTDDGLIELNSNIGDLVLVDEEGAHSTELCLYGKMTGKETEIIRDINSEQYLPTECIKILNMSELNKWIKFLPLDKLV